VLLALLVIGVFEFGQEGQFAQVLDALGISRDAGIQNNAAVSAPAASPAPPVPPSIGTDIASVNPVPTERPAANSVSGAMAPSFTASAPIAADGGIAKPAPTEPTASDSSPGATAPASAANASRTTPSTAATAAPAEPAAVAQSSAALPPTTRSAQQHAAHAPASPREACGPRTQFSLYRCMKTQCSQRQWASHAQCARLRATDSVD
jgi:non-specific serine/threonine protein kinase